MVIAKFTFRDLKDRLLSYENFESKGRMTLLSCAEAYLYSNIDGNELFCPMCDLVLNNFTEPVDPVALHQTYSFKTGSQCFELMKRNQVSSYGCIENPLLLEATNPVEALPIVQPLEREIEPELPLTLATVQTKEGYLRMDYSKFPDMLPRERYDVCAKIREEVSRLNVLEFKYPPALCDKNYEEFRRWSFSHSLLIKSSDAKKLAADGFFLNNNKISCVFCHHSYEVHDAADFVDNVLTRHHKNRSSANRACLEQNGNIPYTLEEECYAGIEKPKPIDQMTQLAEFGVLMKLPKHPEFAVDTRRTATFLTYPHHLATSSQTQELAEAGYFYPEKGDAVTCFSCGVTSSKWGSEEGVWQRHARSSTRCQFVLAEKGADFIERTIEMFGEYREPRVEDKINIVTTRMLRPRMDANVIQDALMKLNLKKEKVNLAVINRLRKGENDFIDLADIVKEISELPTLNQDFTPLINPKFPQVFHRPQPIEKRSLESDDIVDLEEEDHESNAAEIADTDDQIEGSEGSPETFRQIASQLTCKICMSEIVGIIFLPCGHLVSCISCAPALLQCPLCRHDIRGTANANFPS